MQTFHSNCFQVSSTAIVGLGILVAVIVVQSSRKVKQLLAELHLYAMQVRRGNDRLRLRQATTGDGDGDGAARRGDSPGSTRYTYGPILF